MGVLEASLQAKTKRPCSRSEAVSFRCRQVSLHDSRMRRSAIAAVRVCRDAKSEALSNASGSAGYMGALYHNRQLTCCYCSCNLFLAIISIMKLGVIETRSPKL